jgi:hypothetical protein
LCRIHAERKQADLEHDLFKKRTASRNEVFLGNFDFGGFWFHAVLGRSAFTPERRHPW